MDEVLTNEHRKSISIYKEIKKYIRSLDEDLISTILIDDYNPTKHLLNVEIFLETLSALEAKPDIIFLESKLVNLAQGFLNNNKLKKDLLRYVQLKRKIPCSLLIVVWYLIRLGQLHCDVQAVNESVTQKPIYFQPAEKIINILPTKFIKQERMALRIMKHTKYKEQLGNIFHVFFNL